MLILRRVQIKIQVRHVKNMIQRRKKKKKIREESVITIVVMVMAETVETKPRDKHMLVKVPTHSIKKVQRKRNQC